MSESVAGKRVVFELSGAREMVNEERARELLNSAALPREALDVTAVKLCNKSFSPEAALVLVNQIKTYPSVAYADISDVIAGRPEEEALRTLSVFCDGLMSYTLREVNLSDNALGKKGINACSGVLVGKAIEKLYLCNNGLSAEACSTVSDILLDGGCPPLLVLHFYNNMSGSGGASAISTVVKQAKLLQDFRFSATRSGNEGCLDIAKALSEIDDLHRLDLSDNSFGKEAAKLLATSLSKQPRLHYLNLRDSGLTEAGVVAVLSALAEAEIALKFLDLSGNDMSSDAVDALAEYLQQFPTLEELHLDDNEIGNEGLTTLIPAIKKLTHLKNLSVCCCELTASSAYALTRTVASLAKFSTLKMDGNQICARGVEEITSIMIRASKVLTDFDENDEDGEDDLDDVLDKFEVPVVDAASDELSNVFSQVKLDD